MVEKLLRKALRGDIAPPIVRTEASQKVHRGVHWAELADEQTPGLGDQGVLRLEKGSQVHYFRNTAAGSDRLQDSILGVTTTPGVTTSPGHLE